MRVNGLTVGYAVVLILALAGVAAIIAKNSLGKDGPLEKPVWAYAIPTKPSRPAVDRAREGERVTLPGSPKSYTRGELINIKKAPDGLADWFPEEHAVPPALVSKGDMAEGGRAILPCAQCHYYTGKGKGENANIAAQPKEYIVATLKDMKLGLRTTAEPRKRNAAAMYKFAAAMTDKEIEEAAVYFSSLPSAPWIEVKESKLAPKVENVGGLLVALTGDQAGWEPLGRQIVETPVDGYHTEVLRDPHSGFIAYVPEGAIETGRRIVSQGVRSVPACTSCHGSQLLGGGEIPSLSGRSPSYMARQINDFRRGARREPQAEIMKPIAKALRDDEIIAVTAYLASLGSSQTAAITTK